MLLGLVWDLCELLPLTCRSGLVLNRSFRPRLAVSGPSCLRVTFIRSSLQGGCMYGELEFGGREEVGEVRGCVWVATADFHSARSCSCVSLCVSTSISKSQNPSAAGRA